MALVFLDNFCLTLTGVLTPTANTLVATPANLLTLCTKIGTGNHTYLTMGTISGSETIKVSCIAGQAVLERGQGGTVPLTGAIGVCLCFKINKLILDELGFKQACVPTITTSHPAYITITPPAVGSCDWKVDLNANFLDRLNACCPVDLCATCTIGNGTYQNATITVVDGKICSVKNGTNIVYQSGGCCGCPTP
jgi:hypothetical protein